MSLQLKINACFEDKCSKLKIYDTSGEYDVITNPSGWGNPNLDLVNVTDAVISLSYTNSSLNTYNVTTTINNATIVNGQFELVEISNLDFNDGIYSVFYVVNDGFVDYSATYRFFSTCKADCCVEKMKVKFKEELCGCNWLVYWDNYKKAEALLFAAKSAFACGKNAQALDLLAQVNKICSIQKCCC
jgi:hypothetical protein